MNTKPKLVPVRMLCALALQIVWASHAQTFTTLKRFGSLADVTGFNPYCQLVEGGDGALYGTTSTGEGNVAGTVFKVQPHGSSFAALKYFTNSLEGASPQAGLTLSSNVLFGTTMIGGTDGGGTVFKLNTDGTGFAVLKSFSYGDGTHPVASLALDGSVLYGTTTNGGNSDLGTVFKVNTDGTDFMVLKHFTGGEGAKPFAGLTFSGGVLYGTTSAGGGGDAGTVFKLNPDGTGFTTLKEFTSNEGTRPSATLTLSGSLLYGTTSAGGGGDAGTVFKLNTDGTGFAVVLSYFGEPEEYLSGPLTLNGTVLYGTTSGNNPSSGGTIFRVNTDGTGFEWLMPFTGNAGANPRGGVLLSGDQLFGTAANGGIARQGTVFKLSSEGSDLSVLKHFGYSDALNPWAGMTSSGNALYGTTYNGGTLGKGTVFQLNLDGTGYTVLKSFTGSDGANPQATLTSVSGVLYGTTFSGGSAGSGTVFKLNADGTAFTVLKHCTPGEGRSPAAGLASSDGVLYGTTSAGGSAGAGTVFRMNTDGTSYAVLKHFTGSDGGVPLAAVTLSGSMLYGTTYLGGSSGKGTVFKFNTNGTGYQVLKHFTGSGGDGRNPAAGLTLSGDTLYGTTRYGGNLDRGTVFKLNTDGTDFTVLTDLSVGGSEPLAGLVLSSSVLYGTASRGGSSGYGTVFKLNPDGTDFTLIKEFTGSDGDNPQGNLALVGDALYGTTYSGGNWGGTVFKLNLTIPLPVIQCTNRDVNCEMQWTIIPPTVVDPACPNPGPPTLVGASTNSGSCPQVITLSWHYTNCLQQTVSCDQNIFLSDFHPPMVVCPGNKSVQCGTAWTFDTPLAFDTCWGTNVTIRPAIGPITNSSCPLILQQNWSIFDGCGNGSFCSQQVTVVDTNPPTLVCPTNMVVGTSDTNGVAVHWALNPSAVCASLAGVASSPPSGTTFLPDTTNTVTAWAWTECLLTNSCNFTVTVRRASGVSFLGFNTAQFFSTVGATDAPTEGTVLLVKFSEPVASDTFVLVTSSDPTVLVVSSGGVTVPAGQVSAAVSVSSFGPGTVTLTASYAGVQSTATGVVISDVPARPVLSINTLPGAVRLAWTTNAVGFLLESNNMPASIAGWGVFTSNYFVLSTNYVVTNLLDDPVRFFRLRRP